MTYWEDAKTAISTLEARLLLCTLLIVLSFVALFIDKIDASTLLALLGIDGLIYKVLEKMKE